MTYRDIINIVGIDKFKEYGKQFYNLDYVLNNLDCKCNRYAMYGYLPFYIVDRVYNSFYEKDESIGSTYDWLEDYPTEDEIKRFGKGELV